MQGSFGSTWSSPVPHTSSPSSPIPLQAAGVYQEDEERLPQTCAHGPPGLCTFIPEDEESIQDIGTRFFDCAVCLEPLHQELVVAPWVVDKARRTRWRACRHIFHQRCMNELQTRNAMNGRYQQICSVCRVPYMYFIPVPRPFSSPWGWSGVVSQEVYGDKDAMRWDQVAKTLSMCVRSDPDKMHTFFEKLVRTDVIPLVLGKPAHIEAVRRACLQLDVLSPDAPPGGFIDERKPDFFDCIEEWFVFWAEPGTDQSRFMQFPTGLAHALAYTWSDSDHRRIQAPNIAHGDLVLSNYEWVKWVQSLLGPAARAASNVGFVKYVEWQKALALEVVQRLESDFPSIHHHHRRRYSIEHTFQVVPRLPADALQGMREHERVLQRALQEVREQRASSSTNRFNLAQIQAEAVREPRALASVDRANSAGVQASLGLQTGQPLAQPAPEPTENQAVAPQPAENHHADENQPDAETAADQSLVAVVIFSATVVVASAALALTPAGPLSSAAAAMGLSSTNSVTMSCFAAPFLPGLFMAPQIDGDASNPKTALEQQDKEDEKL